MLLGQVLERLGDEVFAAETLVTLEDLPLLVKIEAAGRQFGENIGEYASGASRRFAALASDEDWLALMTALERADGAGTACLQPMPDGPQHHAAYDEGSRDRHCTPNG